MSISPSGFTYLLYDLEPVLKNILKIAELTGEVIEGNCFYAHNTNGARIPELFTKQMNLYNCGVEAKNILEIGFNAGHSCLLFLLANPESKITVFDICEHKYTKPCFEYLQQLFPDRLTLYEGDSTVTVPKFRVDNPDVTFDLIHVDGAHDPTIADKDFQNIYPIASNKIIWDDTQDEHLRALLDGYIFHKLVEELPYQETFVYKHAIVKTRRQL